MNPSCHPKRGRGSWGKPFKGGLWSTPKMGFKETRKKEATHNQKRTKSVWKEMREAEKDSASLETGSDSDTM